MRWALCTARPMPPVSPCAPWLWSGISTPTGLARAATTRRGARRSTTSMASSITPTGSTTSSSPPPWEDENYEPRNPMESDAETAGRPGLPVEAPRRHMGVERGLKGRDELLKLVEGQAGEIQELRRAGLHSGKSYTGHVWCLLSWEAQYATNRD